MTKPKPARTLAPSFSFFPSLLLAVLFLFAGGGILFAGQGPTSPEGDARDRAHAKIARTRWADPNSRPGTREEYLARHPQNEPFAALPLRTFPPPSGSRNGGGTGLFLVIVNSGLEPLIQPALDDYAAGIASEGYTVTVLSSGGGTPADLRALLAGYLPSDLIGTVFIGDLPVAWFEVSGESFPCDLFYMDLDGDWIDTDHNGVYDLHQNNETPEIFLGRLTASPLYGLGHGTEEGRVNNYFAKIQKYRDGMFTVNARALAYPDDDWAYFKACGLNQLYEDVVVVNDKATTNGDDYKVRLQENYEWIHVCVHSWPQGHSFKPYGIVDYWAIRNGDPVAHFYNLFACSNCRYTAKDYMGGWYIFADTYGLAAVGSTKSGSMLDFSDFYAPLGKHAVIGEAFKAWWISESPYSLSDEEWFYGMTLLGDPMLVPAETQLVSAYPDTVSAATGGTVHFGFDLNAKHYAMRDYQLLVSASGTSPRTQAQGLFIPLVFDRLTAVAYANSNNSVFRWFRGNLDNNGDGGARLDVPPLGASWAGRTLDFSLVVTNPADYCTRPIAVRIVP